MDTKRDSRHTIRLNKEVRNMLFSVIYKRSKELFRPVTVCDIVDDGIRAIYENEIVSKKKKRGKKDEKRDEREDVQALVGQSLDQEA